MTGFGVFVAAFATAPPAASATSSKVFTTAFTDPKAGYYPKFGAHLESAPGYIAVGATSAAVGDEEYAGAILVYRATRTTTWPSARPVATLYDPHGSGGFFGRTFAMSGDAILAPSQHGLLLFRRPAGGWAGKIAPVGEFRSPNGARFANFPDGGSDYSLATDGSRFFVGVPNGKRVYGFQRASAQWSTGVTRATTTIGPPHPKSCLDFGGDVAVRGTVVVVASSCSVGDKSANDTHNGQAFSFVRTGKAWPRTPRARHTYLMPFSRNGIFSLALTKGYVAFSIQDTSHDDYGALVYRRQDLKVGTSYKPVSRLVFTGAQDAPRLTAVGDSFLGTRLARHTDLLRFAAGRNGWAAASKPVAAYRLSAKATSRSGSFGDSVLYATGRIFAGDATWDHFGRVFVVSP